VVRLSITFSRVLGSEVRKKAPFATSLLANGSRTASRVSLDGESVSLDREVASEGCSSRRCQSLSYFFDMGSISVFITTAESNDTLQERVETCQSPPVELLH